MSEMFDEEVFDEDLDFEEDLDNIDDDFTTIKDDTAEVSNADDVKAVTVNSKVDLSLKEISIEDIIPSELKKVGRKETFYGLTGVIQDFGVATPIHVMKLEEDFYILLDGLRRLYSAVKLGQDTIHAVVWDFEDKDEGKQLANFISLMLNRSQNFSNKEIWEQYILLERINSATVGQIEYYLQLNAGDAVKLKDVMECDYDEIQSEFLEGNLTIDGAYKKLNNERKKEQRLNKEENTSIGVDTGKSVGEEDFRLSSEEVLDILELNETSDVTLDNLNKSVTGEIPIQEEATMQDPKNRKPLDPKLRAAVLERDKMTCQCCGIGGEQHLHIMDIHHVIQVSQGGMDSLENLITVCINCHHTIHCYAWGKLLMRKETLDSMGKAERAKFANIFKFGNKILEADKRLKGSSDNKKLVQRKMPGTDFKANVTAYNTFKDKEKEE